MKRILLAAAFMLVAFPAFGQSSGFNPTYPPRATAVAVVSSGADTASATAAIPALVGQTGYICGFDVSGLGSTAGANVTVTVGPLAIAGSNLSYPYVFTASAATLNTMLARNFSPCIPSNAQNTAITVTVPGSAGNTTTNINVYGYTFPNP